MAYISSIHEQTYTIDISEDGQQRQFVLDGTTHAIDWRQIAPLATDATGHAAQGGRYTLLIQGRSYEIFARRLDVPGIAGGLSFTHLLLCARL